jgi:hypothetical protein
MTTPAIVQNLKHLLLTKPDIPITFVLQVANHHPPFLFGTVKSTP